MSNLPDRTDRKLENIQTLAFHYFDGEANSANGLIRDKTAPTRRLSSHGFLIESCANRPLTTCQAGGTAAHR